MRAADALHGARSPQGASTLALWALALALTAVSSGRGVEVWVGNGCFFRLQHAIVSGFEEKVGRENATITSFAAYAGGVPDASTKRSCQPGGG